MPIKLKSSPTAALKLSIRTGKGRLDKFDGINHMLETLLKILSARCFEVAYWLADESSRPWGKNAAEDAIERKPFLATMSPKSYADDGVIGMLSCSRSPLNENQNLHRCSPPLRWTLLEITRHSDYSKIERNKCSLEMRHLFWDLLRLRNYSVPPRTKGILIGWRVTQYAASWGRLDPLRHISICWDALFTSHGFVSLAVFSRKTDWARPKFA